MPKETLQSQIIHAVNILMETRPFLRKSRPVPVYRHTITVSTVSPELIQ